MNKPTPTIEIGDPIVVDGNKYRIRGTEEEGRTLLLAMAPSRRPTHRLRCGETPEWDKRIGVWRVYVHGGPEEIR